MCSKEISDKLHQTLIEAIKDEDLVLVRQLLDVIPIDKPINQEGMTVLAHVASCCLDRDIVQIVTLKNPNVNVVDEYDRTPLMHAVSVRINEQDLKGMQVNLDLVTYLVQAGADKKARTKGGETALTYAVRGNRLRVVAALLNGAFFPGQLNGLGESALDLAHRIQPDHVPLIEIAITQWKQHLGEEKYNQMVQEEQLASEEWQNQFFNGSSV